jgi:AbiV family abortive infection protein
MKDEKLVRFNAFRKLCLQNAEDNLSAAKVTAEQKINHVAYHLAVLSLEEIGKIFMTFLGNQPWYILASCCQKNR